MRRWSAPFWRPLLGVRRTDLRVLLGSAGLPWREDPTNGSDAFARNRIRMDVLPALERAVGPCAVSALARFAALAADDEAVLEAAAHAAAARAITREDASGIELERRTVLDLPPAVSRRILRGCCERLAGTTQVVSAAHLAALLDLVRADSPGTRADLPLGLTARRRGRALLIARTPAAEGTPAEMRG
jgi:tRNA(Ile)-lysidine synthase